MNPIRRELLNGLFVLIVGSLLSTGVAAFQVNFNVQLWVLIVLSVAVAITGYVVFEFLLSADERERASAESTRQREEEWLKRVGNPARLEMGVGPGTAGTAMLVEAVKAMRRQRSYDHASS
jgi:membrane protein implicated in regulation of membrane protease activity